MIVAEGLLPYLPEKEVPRLFERLTGHFPWGEIAFDGYSRLGLQLLRLQPSVRATGASVHWSIDDPRKLERKVPRLKFVAGMPFMIRAGARMSWFSRLILRVFQAIPPLRRVGRFLRYRF
jgi:O-methyltransferase involved in polyketide biosynthesis